MKQRMIVVGVVSVATISLMLGCANLKGHETHEEHEIKLTLADCPKAVQDTIRNETGEGKVTDVDRENEHGKTVYEADAMIGGKNYEIKVSDGGTLISKRLDDEKDEHE